MIKQIEYENKQAIQNDDSIANKNKVTAEDMNEIKNVVNQNAKELETLQEDNQGNETAIGTLQNDISLIKQNNSEQDKSIQSNTSKIEAINKSIEAINKKNTEQDTNIQKNASEIENLKQENIEIKAENERLRDDIKSIALTGEESGESIDLEDSSEARFNKFEIGGNHKQETREGYNLLNMSKAKGGTSNGITCSVNSNGSYSYVGTATNNAINVFMLGYYGENVPTLFKLAPGTYYIKDVLLFNNTQSINSKKDQFFWTINEETNITGVRAVQAEIGKTYNEIKYPIVALSNKEVKWEPYGAMPSLEFPSEIKTVKDNANVVVCNENLLYINKEINKVVRGGVTIEVLENGNVRLNGTSTSIIWVSLLEINNYSTLSWKKRFFTKGKIYGYYNYIAGSVSGGNVSFNIRETTTSSSALGLNITADNFRTNRVVQGTIENSLNVEYLWINTNTTFNNLEFNLQLKKENNSADFVEHQSQSITMPTQQEMLKGDYFDWKNEKQSNLFEKIILDGVNKKCTTSKAVGDGNEFQWAFTIAQATSYIRKVYSNIAKQASDFNQINGIKISVNSNIVYVRSEMKVLNGKGATVENVNELLKNMYDNGNPAIFYIEKASNKELDFTDEQKVVAKKIKETLHTYKNITHIYSTDKTSPVLNVEYAKDLNTTISNIQALVLNNASEEVNG